MCFVQDILIPIKESDEINQIIDGSAKEYYQQFFGQIDASVPALTQVNSWEISQCFSLWLKCI